MLEKIIKDEPLRLRLYSLAVLVLGYLVARGIVSVTDAEFYGGIIVVVLGVETTRAKVTPAAKVHTDTEQFYGKD